MTLKFLAALVLLLTLFGCGCAPNRSLSFSPPSVEQQLFNAGLEEIPQTSTPEAFERLRQDYPQSPWTARAIQIQRLINDRDKQSKLANRQKRDLTRMQLQIEQLEQDKTLLQGDLAKLKQLLIDNELRTR